MNREGSPKLLDFGIAKLLAPESISHTLPVTRLQERVLTPENAAPEQVLGRPITTATDIYALGVLLYQLLSGRPPYRLASYSQLQLERAICMDDPVRASQAVTAKLTGESELDRQRISDRRGLSPERLRHVFHYKDAFRMTDFGNARHVDPNAKQMRRQYTQHLRISNLCQAHKIIVECLRIDIAEPDGQSSANHGRRHRETRISRNNNLSASG